MSPRHQYTGLGQVLLAVLLVLPACFNEGRKSQYVDAGPLPDAPPRPDAANTCPSDMVFVSEMGICIDRYEASISNGAVASQEGKVPWSSVTHANALQSCLVLGKRLCEEYEWKAACSGPAPGTVYPYGDTYLPEACVSIASLGTIQPTGSKASCEGGYPGLFDMIGNVVEWTATCSGAACSILGGGSSDGGARCSSSLFFPTDPAANRDGIGFRCCLTAPPAE